MGKQTEWQPNNDARAQRDRMKDAINALEAAVYGDGDDDGQSDSGDDPGFPWAESREDLVTELVEEYGLEESELEGLSHHGIAHAVSAARDAPAGEQADAARDALDSETEESIDNGEGESE